jgi:3-hydroxyacyl-CoA dehydrogenase/enoyl-CoA hydratase/carnithine racemase
MSGSAGDSAGTSGIADGPGWSATGPVEPADAEMIGPVDGDVTEPADADLVAAYPDELVTRALSRDVDLPGGGGTLVLITLDNGRDHSRPNTLGPAGLLELERAIVAALHRTDVAALAITGKPYNFAAGADLQGAASMPSREWARAIARLGHRVLRRLGAAAIPTFAFWNGLALGGGVEIGLHCGYRTISAAAGAVALPECSLGLVPGWGGSYLLPRLIGPAAAVRVIVENPLARNTMLTPAQAVELGLADALFEPADFLEQSIQWAGDVVAGRRAVQRPAVADAGAFDAAVTHGRAGADGRLHGAAPAPYRALELIAAARTADRDEAFAAEDAVLTDLLVSDEFRASLYAFDLVQRRAKRPTGAPDPGLARPVTKVGIVGAGLMATQLAVLFARRLRVPVVMADVEDERVDRGLSHVREQVGELVVKGRLGPGEAARLRGGITAEVGLGAFTDADLVIEAVFEDLAVKQQVLSDVERVVGDDCVLATNTSSLSIDAMSRVLRRPQRLVGMHFFNPVAVMPLLEVVRTEWTDDGTIATALSVGGALRKTCVLVADAPAFVVNRVLARLLGAINSAVDDGAPVEVANRALDPLGLPMRPYALLTLTGPAIALHVSEVMHAAFPDRFAVSPALRRLVESGELPSASLAGEPWGGVAREQAERGAAARDEVAIRRRALVAVADEIRRMLDDGVVADVRDIDLAMILGAGWPFHLGGIAPYLDRSGLSESATGRRFLPHGVASVPVAGATGDRTAR